MSRPVLAPLAVALSALLLAPQVLADTTSPLFVIEQQRSALVSRLAKQWSDAFATLPKERRLDHEQLSSALFALRADRLFAVTIAGDAEAVEAVLAEAKREAAKPRVATKALGDVTADLSYTPINPCRILDTRSTVAGPLTPNVARTFDGYSTNFATQGGTGSSCGIPSGVAALAMNVYAVNPTNLGFIKVWPANAAEPDVSTVNYQVGITAIATGALVPVDAVNSNQFTAKSPATVDFIADVVGYFKPPGDTTGLDIKVAGQRVMRYEYNAISPSVIGGSPANSVTSGVSGATIAGGGSAGIGANTVTAKYGSIGGGERNKVNGEGSTVGGGLMNTATSSRSVIAGGYGNSAIGLANTVSGGESNDASGLASVISGGDSNRTAGYYSSVGGGYNNWASADNSHIGGGQENRANQAGATICGGLSNLASGMVSTTCGGSQNIANGHYSFIAGGTHNVASGYYSFAGGSFARTQTADLTPIVHNGAFVWAGANSTTFHSAAENEFAVRATGGVRFVTAIDGTGLPTWTCGVSGGAGGSWGCSSDRKLKTDLVPLDNVATLDRLAALPVYQWVAKDDPRRTPHAGPTAQDFMAAFGLGDNDKMIGFADAQGVLFSAVQGLNAKLVEKNGEIESLKAEMAEIRRAVEVLLTRTSPEGRVAERR